MTINSNPLHIQRELQEYLKGKANHCLSLNRLNTIVPNAKTTSENNKSFLIAQTHCSTFRCEDVLKYDKLLGGRIGLFSFECRKVIGFAFATLHDWLKKFAPIFHPIRSKTKTNRDSLARVFPRFASVTVSYL